MHTQKLDMVRKKDDLIKINWEFIDAQRKLFKSPGDLLQDLLNVSRLYPWQSLVFLLTFGILTNALFSMLTLFLPSGDGIRGDFAGLILINLLLISLLFVIFFRIKKSRNSIYKRSPLQNRKALVTIASYDKRGYKQTAAHSFYKTMLYHEGKISKPNALEKVYIIASEDKVVKRVANDLAKEIREQKREAVVLPVRIGSFENNVENIKQQICSHLEGRILKSYRPYEIVADYTGGTKELGIALYLACIQYFVLPAYLNVSKTTVTGQVDTTESDA